MLTVVFLPVAFAHHVMIETSVVRLVRDMRVRLYEHVQRMSADWLRDQVVDVPELDSTWRAVRRVLRQAGYRRANAGESRLSLRPFPLLHRRNVRCA